MGVLEAIGNTPLVRLDRLAPAGGAELWVKLEAANPTGSYKDRMALAIIERAVNLALRDELEHVIAGFDPAVELAGVLPEGGA